MTAVLPKAFRDALVNVVSHQMGNSYCEHGVQESETSLLFVPCRAIPPLMIASQKALDTKAILMCKLCEHECLLWTSPVLLKL